MRRVLDVAIFFALWLLMSGVYKPLVIGLGAASAILAAYIVERMERASNGAYLSLPLRPIAFIGYIAWLFVEIAKSNWAVIKAIMSPDMPIRQHFFTIPMTQKSDIGQTAFANSITLTPGTITVEIDDDCFYVHALQYCEGDLVALADMDARVTATEAV